MGSPVVIAGFFPPPITGQGLATQRLADLLEPYYEVYRVNLREGEQELDLRVAGRLVQKIKRYREAGRRLEHALERFPEATVLWTAISPESFGHFRDLTTIVPAFKPSHSVYAVVHWGKFARLFASPITRWTAPGLVRRLDGVVFLNEDRAARCAAWVPDSKRFIVPNTLDEAVLCSNDEAAAKIARRSAAGPLRVLFISNMLREKGYLDVLDALAFLNERDQSVEATFAGQWLDPADRDAFEKRIAAHQLGDAVRHLGPVNDRDQIRALHLEADVFVLPSYLVEGQPLTLIEAFNAGSPVITTRIGGMVDMVEEGQEGYFVPPRAPEAIAGALQQLAHRPTWQRMARAARTRFEQRYSPERVAACWRAMIDRGIEE